MQSQIVAIRQNASNLESASLRPRSENKVRLLLIGGFILIIALLTLDGFVGFHGVTSVRQSLDTLTRNQLLESSLIDQVEHLQLALNSIETGPQLRRSGNQPQISSAPFPEIERAIGEVFARMPEDSPNRSGWSEVRSVISQLKGDLDQISQTQTGTPTDPTALRQDRERLSLAIGRLIRSSHQQAEITRQKVDEATRWQSIEDRLLLAACLLVACLFLRTATRIYCRMNEQSQELHLVSWQLLEKQESLARRLSRELHDELGQSLTALKTNFSRHAASACVDFRWMQDCTELLKGSIQSAHEISQLLRPTLLDDFGLDCALAWLCERFEDRNQITVQYESDFHNRLEEQAETHIFRIAQEALTNIARHAEASRVRVVLSREGRLARLTISDNGKGMGQRPPDGSVSFGLTGMKARARSLQGEIKIESVPGIGTHIEICFPFRTVSHEEVHSHLVS
jgi:signal transduction histidine kinase